MTIYLNKTHPLCKVLMMIVSEASIILEKAITVTQNQMRMIQEMTVIRYEVKLVKKREIMTIQENENKTLMIQEKVNQKISLVEFHVISVEM